MAQGVEHLVGRAAELGALDEALAAVERSRPVVLALVGEPGIGKTRLLTELGARADARGALVLSGSASEFERDLPFWVFVDALDEYVHGLAPHRLAALDEDGRAELAHVFPSLDGGGDVLQAERYRSHRAVRQLLEALAGPKPLVLLLDDLHWADSGTIELLGALLRRPPAGPVLIAFTLRPRQVPERLAGALERAHRAGELLRVEVGALSSEEASELLGPNVAIEPLYEESGGNPFYLQQLARAPQRARVPASAVVDGGMPAAVAAALTDELALLDPGPRRVLEGAAVAGDPFEPDLAAAAAGVDEREALEALDELLARDLVRPTDVPRRFRFRHPLVRLAVYEAAPGGWRLRAHEQCANALAARGAPAPARAHHVEHAARHGDLDAIAVLREAGEAVLQRTPAGAATWFAAALRLLPDSAPVEERVGLLSALAGALAATGRFQDAHGALLETLRVLPREAGDMRVQLIGACARVEQLLRLYDESRARLESALDAVDDPGSAQATALMIDLGISSIYRMDYGRGRDWSERALRAALPLGVATLTASATALLGFTCALEGATEPARQHCDEAAALVGRMTDHELATCLEAIGNLAVAEFYLDRLEASGAHLERAVALARATGQSQLFPTLLPLLGSVLTALGRPVEAIELLEGATEGARVAGNDDALAWALFHRANAALFGGDLDAARACAQESLELARDRDENVASCYAGLVLGCALLDGGDPAGATEVMVRHGGGEGLPLAAGNSRGYYLARLCEAWLAQRRRAEAERAAAGAEAVAQGTGLPSASAAARRAQAALALDAGDAQAAAEHALRATVAAADSGRPIEAAAMRTVAGRALAQAGEPERAAAELARAAAELDACGALRYRDAAERELRRLGHRRLHRRTRPGKADGSGVESLTERELQIARLVVDRKTNAQIAAELFLSPKTVESHIRNLFHKLDVSSRVEVARVVERANQGP
jgi:ATP/maltotriose-dependent transcriptional regulator MalT